MPCPKAKPPINKSSAIFRLLAVVVVGMLSAPVRASVPAEATHPSLPAVAAKPGAPILEAKTTEAPEPAVATQKGVLNEISAYARLAQQAADQSKWPLAEHFLERLVNLPATDQEKKSALVLMAQTYEKLHAYSKAIAIFEKLNKLFPTDSDRPERLLHLGKLYRDQGAPSLAISRFYSVLNSSLVTGGAKIDSSRQLTQRAQGEIADTYFETADYVQAQRFYELLSRLDLSGGESGRVRFRIVHCLYLLGQTPQSVVAAQKFLDEYPDDPSAPECRYILATSLRTLKHPKEAYEQVLALLREQKVRKDKAPEKWVYWQKKTGNEFANDLYQNGEYLDALTVYQSLATLEDSPDWQWPVVYQIGLCFEKLRVDRRAAEAYKFILDEAKKPGRDLTKYPETVQNTVKMAQWRGDQVVWQSGTGVLLERILGARPETQQAANQVVPFR